MVSKSVKENLQLIGFFLFLGGLIANFYVVYSGSFNDYQYRVYASPLFIIGVILLGLGLIVKSPKPS